jgi:hypothetical protein
MNKSSMNSPSSGSEQDGKIVDQAKQAATHVASNVANQAREQVNTQFDTRKDKAVETMGNVANAIRETSDKLKGVGPLGDVAGRAADSIDHVAEFFEGKQIGDVVRDVERFARREPALFLGAAFAIGLIGGRFLKSSAPQRASQRGYDREGGMEYDRYEEAYGSSFGGGSYEESFLSDDDLEEDIDSYRASQQQRAGRATLPQGSRSYGASSPSTSSTSSTGSTSSTSRTGSADSTGTGSSSGTSATPFASSTTGGSTPGSTPNGVSKSSGTGGSQGSV